MPSWYWSMNSFEWPKVYSWSHFDRDLDGAGAEEAGWLPARPPTTAAPPSRRSRRDGSPVEGVLSGSVGSGNVVDTGSLPACGSVVPLWRSLVGFWYKMEPGIPRQCDHHTLSSGMVT